MATILEKAFSDDLLPFGAISGGYAREWAAYKQALQRVEAMFPDQFGGPGITPLSTMDEAAIALCLAAWHAGTAVGDAFARAEEALHSPPERVCDHCDGYGKVRRGEYKGQRCIACRGRGVVPAGETD